LYAGSVDFRRFRTPSLPSFGVILAAPQISGMRKHTMNYARSYIDY